MILPKVCPCVFTYFIGKICQQQKLKKNSKLVMLKTKKNFKKLKTCKKNKKIQNSIGTWSKNDQILNKYSSHLCINNNNQQILDYYY